jgi:hypothetical protein
MYVYRVICVIILEQPFFKKRQKDACKNNRDIRILKYILTVIKGKKGILEGRK